MKDQLRNKYLSRPRYNRYLNAVGNDSSKAKRLYNANIRLAQAFHPVITQFEVILRNSLNTQLTSYFVDTDWIINEQMGFMNDRSLRRSSSFLKKSIQRTESKLRRRRIPVTSGKNHFRTIIRFLDCIIFKTPIIGSLVANRLRFSAINRRQKTEQAFMQNLMN